MKSSTELSLAKNICAGKVYILLIALVNLSSHRSRAVQISMNLGTLDEWIEDMDLPTGIQSHFAPVRDLLNWLQVGLSVLSWSSQQYFFFLSVFHQSQNFQILSK